MVFKFSNLGIATETMKHYALVIIPILFTVGLESCPSFWKKIEITKKFCRKTGEAIAFDYLIQRYELEHQKLYEEKKVADTNLKWPALNKKNLSEYCKKYLQFTVPGRTTDNANGSQLERTLLYEKENTSTANKIAIVRCKVMYRSHTMVYYMTRAPEPHCVYALKGSGPRSAFILTIINKYCNFETKQPKISIKRKRVEMISKIHRFTGQPIANDQYLLKYELEHHALLKKEGDEDKYVSWPYETMDCNYLDSYCYQYMKRCTPGRNREGVRGNWRTEKLHYNKLNSNSDIIMTVVHCQQDNASKVNYYFTKALERNCVFALLRQGHRNTDPLAIIFKHCDDQQAILQDYNIFDKNVIPKTEVKEETPGTFGTLQFFPND